MSTISSILPREIKASILKDVILHKGTFTCRLVCNEWKTIIDQDILKIFVTELQRRLKEIPQSLHTIVITFTDQANPQNTTILQCDIKTFQAFDKHLKTVICPIKKTCLIVSPDRIKALNKKDTNLHILWDAIKTKVNPPPSSPLQTWSEISTWMKDNSHALASITNLDLSSKGLTALPPEIGLLTQLQRLNLQNNQITSLSSEFGKLTQLQWLNLKKNQITSLSGIEKLTQLQRLDLENNQVTNLLGIEKLTQLQGLYLANNQIKSLAEIEKLAQLQGLSLENNQITSLAGIEKLTQLQWLYLENNQIKSLAGIENLTQLQWLGLANNQITSLPSGIEKFSRLRWFYLNSNPLLFIHDNILSSCNEVFNSNERIQQFKDECRYPAASAFAQLYQAIIMRENENGISEKIKTAFKELKEDDRNLIYKMVYVCSGSPQTSDLQWGEHHVFDHPDTFFRAVHKASLAKFNKLTLDAKNKVYRFVYVLAGKPITSDFQWGEHNALKNLPRLFDALEMR